MRPGLGGGGEAGALGRAEETEAWAEDLAEALAAALLAWLFEGECAESGEAEAQAAAKARAPTQRARIPLQKFHRPHLVSAAFDLG